MEKIKEYLKNYGLSYTEAAQELGVSRQYLSLIANGHLTPGVKLAKKLEQWSNGEIEAREIMGL